jgi:hypothetical protein
VDAVEAGSVGVGLDAADAVEAMLDAGMGPLEASACAADTTETTKRSGWICCFSRCGSATLSGPRPAARK